MLLLIDRLIRRIIMSYRQRIFEARLSGKTPLKLKILGNVHMRATNVSIGYNVTLYPNVTFWGDGEISIGDNVDIGNDTIIFASKNGGVYIGDNTSIAAHCYIIDSDHGMEKNTLIRNQVLKSAPVFIGDDVWIAENCSILKGSVIKNGAVVGAKSLVNGLVDSYGIAVGVPAKVIKYRT